MVIAGIITESTARIIIMRSALVLGAVGGALLLGGVLQLFAVIQQWSLRQTTQFYAEPATLPAVQPFHVPTASPLLPATGTMNAGYLLLQQGLQAPLSEQPELFRRAAKTLADSLQRNPHNPYAHAYSAQVQALLRKPTAMVLEHLRQSAAYGPHEERLLLWRSRALLSYWQHLSTADKESLKQQLLHAWRYRWYSTTKLLATFGKGELLDDLLSVDDKAKFQQQYQKFLQ